MSTRCIDVVLLTEALRHNTGGSGSDSRYVPWTFSSDLLLSALSSPGIHSASNRNEYQGISLGVKCGQVRIAEASAVLVLPDIKVRVQALPL